MLMRKLIFLVVLCCQIVSAQQLQFQSMGGKLSLPSQECYNVMQDSKGYLWFGTELGFCRYDGTNITVYDSKNGLPEGGVYSVAEDSKGRLWLTTSQNRILVMENGRLREATFSEVYQKRAENNVTQNLVLAGSNLYIGYGATAKANIDSEKIEFIPLGKIKNDFTLTIDSGKLIPYGSLRNWSKKSSVLRESKTITFDILRQGKLPVSLVFSKKSTQWTEITNTHQGPKCNYFSIANNLVSISPDFRVQSYEMPKRILSFHADRDGGIWVGIIKEGLFYYPDGDLSKPPVINLKGYSVTGVIEDTEGNIWCTTLEKGIFMCRNKNIINYFNIPGMAKPADMLKYVDGATFISSEANEFIELRNGNFKRHFIKTFSAEPMSDIIKIRDGSWYIGGKQLAVKTDPDFRNPKSLWLRQMKSVMGVTNFLPIGDELYAASFGIFSKVDGVYANFITFLSDRMKSCAHYRGNLALYGTDSKLELLDIGTGKSEMLIDIGVNITKIIKISESDFLIATKGKGLYRYNARKTVPVTSFLLPTNVLYDIIDDGQHYWIASNKGLIKVNHTGKHETRIFTKENGLPSNDIYKVCLSGEELMLSTPEGICSFPVAKDLTNTTRPNIYLSQLSVNGKPFDANKKLQLSHDENSIRAVFDILTFKGNTFLFYTLNGGYPNGGYDNEIVLDNLSPGDYELIVSAGNNDQIGSKPVVIRFEIAKPFWAETWFVLICFLLFALAIYFAVRKIIRRIKSKEAEKTRINKLIAGSQLAALRAQMNPHFIFNAINSIQNYILKKQETQAYNYLAKFSKLIRLVLHQSQQQMLSLHQELEMVKLYVELEQLRFGNFDFAIEGTDDIDEFETQLPAMIIQPYLENAIWHGLMNLDGQRKGKLSLRFSNENGLLKIEIEDNGIGREKSRTFQSANSHQPVAMKLTEQRLAIVNQMYSNEKVSVSVTDLYEWNEPSGTRVTIYLPISNTENDDR